MERDGIVFGPVVEKINDSAFITEDPVDMMLNGKFHKVPILSTYTNKECLLVEKLANYLRAKGKVVKPFHFEPTDILPAYFKAKMEHSDLNKISSEMDKIYSMFDDSTCLVSE